jgi:drug/metabolite transporter (DMT)-like permease
MLGATVICHSIFLAAPSMKQSSLSPEDSPEVFLRFCVIAGLFATSLTSANAALARLDVASVQMIKAVHPAIIYLLGIACGIERLSCSVCVCIAIICGGVMVAVQGAILFQPVGVCLQLLALVADGVRFLYLQATMQSCKGALDPINVLDRVAPIASALIWMAGSILEFPRMHLGLLDVFAIAPLVIGSSILAFALNISSYAYIQATSALTMGVSGIFRDVLLIGMSVAYFNSSVTIKQSAGYATAIAGTLAYLKCREEQSNQRNFSKIDDLPGQKHSY